MTARYAADKRRAIAGLAAAPAVVAFAALIDAARYGSDNAHDRASDLLGRQRARR